MLLGLLTLFSWTGLVGLVRAEFLRTRNFDYVRAARAMGVGDIGIMRRHILPNAMVSTLTFLPFIMSGAATYIMVVSVRRRGVCSLSPVRLPLPPPLLAWFETSPCLQPTCCRLKLASVVSDAHCTPCPCSDDRLGSPAVLASRAGRARLLPHHGRWLEGLE